MPTNVSTSTNVFAKTPPPEAQVGIKRPYGDSVNQPSSVATLVEQLVALGDLSAAARSRVLEVLKSEPKYKAIFTAAEAPGIEIRVPADMPVKGPGAVGQGTHSPLTVKVVPEFIEVSSGATALKVVVSLMATSEVSKPVDVALVAVVDMSGSMAGNKIELVKGTVDFLADQLGPQDALGLVTYNNKAKRNLPLLMTTPSSQALAKAVNKETRTGGGTTIYDGLAMAVREHLADAMAAKREHLAGGPCKVRSIFLCTDGRPNAGPTDAKGIMAALQPELAALADVEEPCSIHTFGFGSDQDPKLLQAIAEGANGMYYYIEDECQIPEAFGDALGGLLSVVACNVNITVTTVNGAAKIDNVKSGGMKPQLTQSAVAHTSQAIVKFADLYSEETREVLLELELPVAAEEVGQQLLKVDVSFTDTTTGLISNSSQVLTLCRRATPAASQNRNALVATTAARFLIAEALKAATAANEANRFDAASALLDEVWTKIEQEEGLDEAVEAFKSQLDDMKASISAAKRAANLRERQTHITRLTASGTAMSIQRAAGVGLTGTLPSRASTDSHFSMPAALGGFGQAMFKAAPPPHTGQPQGNQLPASVAAPSMPASYSSQPLSNSVRMRMSVAAAEYVSKRSRLG